MNIYQSKVSFSQEKIKLCDHNYSRERAKVLKKVRFKIFKTILIYIDLIYFLKMNFLSLYIIIECLYIYIVFLLMSIYL